MRENSVSIEHLEIRKSAIEKVKKFFKIDDDSEQLWKDALFIRELMIYMLITQMFIEVI